MPPAVRIAGELLLAILVTFAVAILAGVPARAEPASDVLAELASPRFDTVRHGVESLAYSGDPQALPVIAALHDGELYVRANRTLFIKNGSGFLDAATGATAPDVALSGLKKVRVNNRVREAINDALGALRLFSPDPAARAAAAEAVFHSHDPRALPALDRALAKETEPAVKRRLEQARAAALLFSPGASTADRLTAIATVRARRDLDSRALLDQLSGQPPQVREAAATAVRAIDRVLALWNVAQSVYYGISLGSVLLLAAAGLAITFGVMGVINMAHGEMVMLGAYTAFVVQAGSHLRRARPSDRESADLDPGRVPRRGPHRHRDRAHADPLALRPTAGDVARHLGLVAAVAAIRPLDIRRR